MPGGYIPAQQDSEPYAAAPDDQEGTGTYAAVPQQNYGEWDAQQYQGAGYGQYQGGQDAGQYQDGQDAGQYQDGQYHQADPYQHDPYQQQGAYDPYGYPQQQPYAPGTGEAAPYDGHEENTAPGQGPWPTGNASRGESE